MEELIPTTEEMRRWLLGTLRHVQHIEYYLERLGVGKEDPQRPHDIMGFGNKLEWEVMSGFALQYRDRSPAFFSAYIIPSLERHRCQYHHVKWNAPNPQATSEDMKLGAVDAICSLLEPDREYQGGRHSASQIDDIIEGNPGYKQAWMREVHKEMKRIEAPPLHRIAGLRSFPNVGIVGSTYETIRGRMHDTLAELAERGYLL
jgi:hypothetical protein